MKTWLLSALTVCLVGCSSKPIELNYYVLHDPTQNLGQSTTDISSQPTIFLRSLTTPDYLKQRNLSLQLSNSELHFAPNHIWAEPFHSDFTMALAEAFSVQHNIRLRIQSKWTNPAQPEYILDMQLDDFITTYNGDLVLKGKFRLETDQTSAQIVKFNYLLPLQTDGFDQAVVQMRSLINKLAKDVVSNLEKNH